LIHAHPKVRTTPFFLENNSDYHDVYNKHYAETENNEQKKPAMRSNIKAG
jgi:hypothetical protein